MLEVKQFERDQVIFGRDADVQVELRDEDVSAIHCLIELRDSGYYVCDLGSETGTFKNGQQILDEPISSGDQIRIGPFTAQFFVGVPKPKAPPTGITSSQSVPVTSVTATPNIPKNNVSLATVVPSGTSSKSSDVERTVISKQGTQPAVPPQKQPVKQSSKPPVAPPPPRLPDSGKIESRSSYANKSESLSKKKGHKTFAPPSEIVDLKKTLSPGKGLYVEVIVAWKERVLSTKNFAPLHTALIGSGDSAQVVIPQGFLRGDIPFLNTSAGCVVAVPLEAVAEIVGSDRGSVSGSVKLEQGEMLCISFSGGLLQVFVRFTAATSKPLFAPILDFTSGELTGIVVTLLATSLTALYMSLYTPPPIEAKKEDDVVRLAQFVYNKPKETPTPAPVQVVSEPKKEPVPVPTPVPTPKPEPKKVQVVDKKQAQTQKGNKESVAAVTEKPAARAAEVRPNPSKVDRPKKFTSIKQGGAVKFGDKEGANAQSAKDVNKTGLLSAFGGGGNRTKLDQAYSGSGDLVGLASGATGKAGQSENRAGEDIGSKFKDTGAGGKGTATTGISGVGTTGRSSGQSAYGKVGFAGKGAVRIEAGGTEEEFVGKIDREAVRRAVRALMPLIKNCYNKALNLQKDLEGKIVIKFVIGEQGRIQAASTKSSTMGSGDVEGCVARTIRNGGGFPEPPPGSIAEVDFPFVFSPNQ